LSEKSALADRTADGDGGKKMDLYELKQKIDETQQGQKDAAAAIVAELDKLGVPHYHYTPSNEFILREVGGRKEYLQIYSSSCGLDINVIWWVGCQEVDCDDRDCEGDHRQSRKATADEVVFVLDNYLHEKLRGIQIEAARLREIAASIAEMSRFPEESAN